MQSAGTALDSRRSACPCAVSRCKRCLAHEQSVSQIEALLIWGAAKQYARTHCAYSLAGLRRTIPLALSQSLDEIPEDMRSDPELPVSPLLKQRRHSLISEQYAAEYLSGANCCEAVIAVATHRSKRHRDMRDRRARRAEAAMEAKVMVHLLSAWIVVQ